MPRGGIESLSNGGFRDTVKALRYAPLCAKPYSVLKAGRPCDDIPAIGCIISLVLFACVRGYGSGCRYETTSARSRRGLSHACESVPRWQLCDAERPTLRGSRLSHGNEPAWSRAPACAARSISRRSVKSENMFERWW